MHLQLRCSREQEVQTPEKVLATESWDAENEEEVTSAGFWLDNEIHRLLSIVRALADCPNLAMKVGSSVIEDVLQFKNHF